MNDNAIALSVISVQFSPDAMQINHPAQDI